MHIQDTVSLDCLGDLEAFEIANCDQWQMNTITFYDLILVLMYFNCWLNFMYIFNSCTLP